MNQQTLQLAKEASDLQNSLSKRQLELCLASNEIGTSDISSWLPICTEQNRISRILAKCQKRLERRNKKFFGITDDK